MRVIIQCNTRERKVTALINRTDYIHQSASYSNRLSAKYTRRDGSYRCYAYKKHLAGIDNEDCNVKAKQLQGLVNYQISLYWCSTSKQLLKHGRFVVCQSSQQRQYLCSPSVLQNCTPKRCYPHTNLYVVTTHKRTFDQIICS